MNSPLWHASPVCWSTRELRSSCWICQVSLKEPRTEKVVVSKLSLSQEHAILSSWCWMPPDQCTIRKSSNTNYKALVFDWTRSPQPSTSSAKTKVVSLFPEWLTPLELMMNQSRPSWNNTGSTVQISVWSVMQLKTTLSISLKAIENISPVCMHSTKSTLLHLNNSTSSTKLNTMSQFQEISSGTSTS